MTRKGMKTSEEVRKKISKSLTKNRECSIDGCNKPHDSKGFCHTHYQTFRRRTDPEYRTRINKNQMKKYHGDDHEERKQRKRVVGKLHRINLYKKLGGKCNSCGEKLNELLQPSNLEIHHKSYDSDDEKIKAKFKGNLGSKHHWEINRMIKNGINPRKKFVLLCRQCHKIETASHQNPKKAFDMFAWLYADGLFDQVLKADPKLKKLTEFLK